MLFSGFSFKHCIILPVCLSGNSLLTVNRWEEVWTDLPSLNTELLPGYNCHNAIKLMSAVETLSRAFLSRCSRVFLPWEVIIHTHTHTHTHLMMMMWSIVHEMHRGLCLTMETENKCTQENLQWSKCLAISPISFLFSLFTVKEGQRSFTCLHLRNVPPPVQTLWASWGSHILPSGLPPHHSPSTPPAAPPTLLCHPRLKDWTSLSQARYG